MPSEQSIKYNRSIKTFSGMPNLKNLTYLSCSQDSVRGCVPPTVRKSTKKKKGRHAIQKTGDLIQETGQRRSQLVIKEMWGY